MIQHLCFALRYTRFFFHFYCTCLRVIKHQTIIREKSVKSAIGFTLHYTAFFFAWTKETWMSHSRSIRASFHDRKSITRVTRYDCTFRLTDEILYIQQCKSVAKRNTISKHEIEGRETVKSIARTRQFIEPILFSSISLCFLHLN